MLESPFSSKTLREFNESRRVANLLVMDNTTAFNNLANIEEVMGTFEFIPPDDSEDDDEVPMFVHLHNVTNNVPQ